MKQTKYVASCSFGKDSLAMLIKIKELGLPLDEVIYVDVRFDDETSGEMPLMADFIPKAEKILKEKFNIEVKHLYAKHTYVSKFFDVKKKGKRIGENYGFPVLIGAWCNNYLKMQPIRQYMSNQNANIIQYIGIAYDEPERYERLNHKTEIAPLYDLKITEEQAFKICEEYDLISPQYQESSRGGCWFCPKQSMSQLKNLYLKYPRLWEKLKQLEPYSNYSFRYKYTFEQLEEKFKHETN